MTGPNSPTRLKRVVLRAVERLLLRRSAQRRSAMLRDIHETARSDEDIARVARTDVRILRRPMMAKDS